MKTFDLFCDLEANPLRLGRRDVMSKSTDVLRKVLDHQTGLGH